MITEETGFLEVGGQRLHYAAQGEGPPLVFVHGWTLNLQCWNAQVAGLAAGYRTYRYDWRGNGRSTGATPAYTMAQLGEELAGVIAALGLERPVVCGHSLGGAIATQYAAAHPDGPSALILADTDLNSGWLALGGKLEFLFTALFAALQAKAGKDPLAGMMPGLQLELYSAQYIQEHPAAIAAWQRQFLGNSVANVINGLRAWEWRGNLARKLGAFRAPTLLLWGEKDIMISLGKMQALQAALGGASELTTLAGAGHMTPVEASAAFNGAIQGFLDQVPAAGRT